MESSFISVTKNLKLSFTIELFAKLVNKYKLFSRKISILDVRLSSKYAPVAGLSCYKDIFVGVF